jgi:hypothetical protein
MHVGWNWVEKPQKTRELNLQPILQRLKSREASWGCCWESGIVVSKCGKFQVGVTTPIQ